MLMKKTGVRKFLEKIREDEVGEILAKKRSAAMLQMEANAVKIRKEAKKFFERLSVLDKHAIKVKQSPLFCNDLLPNCEWIRPQPLPDELLQALANVQASFKHTLPPLENSLPMTNLHQVKTELGIF